MTIEATSADRSRPQSFPLGSLLATAGARAKLSRSEIVACVQRHARGDFGSLCAEEFEANLAAIAAGEQLLSMYVCKGLRVYVTTEADRSATTVLLAEEL